MTLLGAIYLEDHIVSDRMHSQEDEAPLRCERIFDGSKWMTVESAPHLLWGYAGSDTVGVKMAPVVSDAASDWTALKAALPLHLSSLCGRVGYPTDCLVAGWLNETPGILSASFDGTARGGEQFPPHDTFVGVGCIGVRMAREYGVQCLKAERSTENLCSLMRHAIGYQEGSLRGFDRWDVRSDGVPELKESRPVQFLAVG